MQHRKHLHNTSVHLTALDDRHERVRGALAVALEVLLTYRKRRRARTLAEWAMVLDGLDDMETRRGKRVRMVMVSASSALVKSTQDYISPKRRGL